MISCRDLLLARICARCSPAGPIVSMLIAINAVNAIKGSSAARPICHLNRPTARITVSSRTRRQAAQAEQAADDRDGREQLVQAAWRGQQHVQHGVAERVAFLADVAQLR